MCKSANQPGGPYRCSNDAAKSLNAARSARDKAHEAYQAATAEVAVWRETRAEAGREMSAALDDPAAVYDRGGEELPAAEHVERMIAAGDAPESDRDRPPSEVFNDYRDRNGFNDDDERVPRHFAKPGSAFDQAEDRWLDANRGINTATKQYLDARRAYAASSARLGEASDAYDATHRGLANLTRAHDDTDAEEHPARARVLAQRVERATGRMNVEAALRTRKWGGGQVTYEPVPRRRDTLEQHKVGHAKLAREDGVQASAENHGYYLDGRTGAEGEAYVVALYAKDRTVRVQYPHDTHSEPPTQADVLHRMSDQAGAYERASGGPDGNLRKFRRNWERRDEDFGDDDEAREAALTDDFSNGRRYSQQLRSLFGDDRAKDYMEAARPQVVTPR